jgi:lipopolysaccharide export system permease protein
VWPWANQQTQELKERYGKRGDLERVTPGQFQESASGQRVFFLDKDTPDNKSGRNIFISTREKDRETVTSARSGHVETVGDSQFLILANGQRLESSLNGEGMRISEFELHGTKVKGTALTSMDETPVRARSTLDLVRDPAPRNRGELAWRIGMALAALNLVLLAITVSSVNPRVGRSGNLVFALFAFVVYYNLLNVSQGWVSSGKVPMVLFMLLLHGGTFLLAALWLAKQHNNWAVRPVVRRLRGRGP